MMQGQDWEPIVFRKKYTTQDAKSKTAVAAAQRSGRAVNTVEKDKQREDRDRARKLEKDTENPTEDAPALAQLPSLNKSMQQQMIQARVDKKMNQQALANAINERVQVVQELETGKVITTQPSALLAKVNRALGTRLRYGSS